MDLFVLEIKGFTFLVGKKDLSCIFIGVPYILVEHTIQFMNS